MDDARYVKQVLKGDPDAFDQLVLRYMNKVYFLLYRIIGHAEEAKDLTQECFIRAYQCLYQYNPQYSFSSWLYKIACNLCHNEIQKQKRRRTTVNADIQIEDHQSPEVIVLSKEKKVLLQKGLQQLSETYRLVLILRYHRDLSYREIGEIMGISEKNVSNYLYKSKKALRNILNKDEKEVFA